MRLHRKTTAYLSGVILAALLGAGCGGGGGGGGDSTADNGSDDSTGGDDSTSAASASEFNGTVVSPDGQTVGERDTLDHAREMLAALIGSSRAATQGLSAVPAGTQVALVRLNSDGTVADTLDSTTTSAEGEFSIETDAELTGDLAVLAGTGDTALRAPAGGAGIEVSPVSESIMDNVIDRVSSGDSSFDKYTASELTALVRLIAEEIAAEGVDFSGTSVTDAVDTVDSTAGDSSDQLLTEAEEEVDIEFSGAQNMAVLGMELEGSGEAIFSAQAQSVEANVSAEAGFDLAGSAYEEIGFRRAWQFDAEGALSGYTYDPETEALTPITEEEAPSVDVSLTSTGRMFLSNLDQGSSGRGAISADGTMFANADTDPNRFANINVGANQWSPDDIEQGFNMVRFDVFADESDRSAGGEFAPGQIGLLGTLRADADISCTDGSCDLAIARDFGADTRKFYVQGGPEGDLHAGDSTFTADLAYELGLSDNGRLSDGGRAEEAFRGFVAPDSAMLALTHTDVGDSYDYPFADLLIGLPKPATGERCTEGTFSGTYNMVTLAGEIYRDGDNPDFPGEFSTETSAFPITADGSGEYDFPGSRYTNVELLMMGGAPMTSREISSDSATTDNPYTVEANCRLSLQDDTSGKTYVQGAISPDGETVVLIAFDWEADNRTASSANYGYAQLLIGFRAPSS